MLWITLTSSNIAAYSTKFPKIKTGDFFEKAEKIFINAESL